MVAAGLASGVGNDEMLERIAEVGGRGIVRDPLMPVAGLFLRSLLKPGPLRSAIETSKKMLQDAGAEFVEISIPLTKMAVPVYYMVATSEASSNLARYDGVQLVQELQRSVL